MKLANETELDTYANLHADRLVAILQDLVRLPSVNNAPDGNEWACQQYVATFLRNLGWDPVQYLPTDAPGILDHPLYWPGRKYEKRPNVAGVKKGSGGGRSLLLSGHIDTVPPGELPWKYPPFEGRVEGGRLYGRGSVDMKCGIATNLFVAEALANTETSLAGDLTIESVVDEEFGGVNGTLAGRLMGYRAEAAIISEPSFLRVCPAQRGGRTVDIFFHAPNEGVLGEESATATDQLRIFLNEIGRFEKARVENVQVHPLYAHLENAVPVTIQRIHTAAWGTVEPPNTPTICRVELFWQAMPGESLEAIDLEFSTWFEGMLAAHPGVFQVRPTLEFPIRWLPGSAIDPAQPVVKELGEAARLALGETPLVQGIEGPCDMFVFHEFGIPAVLWGATGANLHQPDEYVEIDSLVKAAKTLLLFVRRWCGEEGKD